jgi:N-acetylglucosamine-6-sulfatase
MAGRRGATLATLLAAALALIVATPAGAKPPNVVVIVTDDQTLESFRPDVMPQTFAKLARRGTTFKQAIVSTPQCCPSRAGFLTGQYAHNNGVVSNQPGYPLLRRKGNVLPAWLQRAGYRTIHIGKFLNGFPGGTSAAPGWDRWIRLMGADYLDPAFVVNGRVVFPGEYLTAFINREAVGSIERFAPRRRPFYLQIDQLAPHTGSRRENSRCVGGPVPPPAEENLFADATAPRTPAVEESDFSDKPAYMGALPVPPRAQLDHIYGCALASLKAVDRGVAAVIGALRRTGELGRTMLIFTSDNGYAFGEHRVRLTKGMPHEEHVRVPLVIRPPRSFPARFRGGASLGAPVSNVDLAATVLGLSKSRPCRGDGKCRRMDGRSLLPLLRGRKPEWVDDRAVLTSFDIGGERYPYSCRWLGLRTPRLSFIRHEVTPRPGTSQCRPLVEYERYDLTRDPFQLDSLGREPGLVRRLERLGRCSGVARRDRPISGVPYCE